MSKVRRRAGRDEPVRLGAILIVDEEQQTRQAVSDRIQSHFDDTYEVAEATDLDETVMLLKSLQDDKGFEVPIIALDLALEFDADSAKLQHLIAKIREEVPPETRIIAYTDKPLEQVLEKALEAGASACVHINDVEAAIHGAFLGNELDGLHTAAPIAARVVNRIKVGISIQNPQMDVLWANERITPIVDESDIARRRCWERYHKFYHRKGPCTGCTAWRVLQQAAKRVREGNRIGNGALTGYHFLPVQGRISRIEVNAAPLTNGDDRKLLAVIEASRFVTDEWEENTAAHDRLYDVIAAARVLGQEYEQALPFAAVAVYYRPEEDEDLHLFDAAAADRGTLPKLLRLTECPTAYREVLADGQPRFFDDEAVGQRRRHFLWTARTREVDTRVVIDVVYTDDKPEGLLTADLRPYWEYVVECFEAARESREREFEQAANSHLETFLARTANGIRDEAGLDRALRAVVDGVRIALDPLSMYVRTLDRNTSTLVKQNGFGPYYEMAPEKRELRHDGIGSGKVASSRKGYWVKHAKMTEIRRFFDWELSQAEETELNRIAGYVTLPLACMDRVFGTLCIQFEDDSLFSPAKRSFVEAMANALGSALGSLQWAHERATIVTYSRDLDKTMFRRSERPEEEETNVLKQVTRMVFELTAAEVAAYYGYDTQSRTLALVGGATLGGLPVDMALPKLIPANVGIVSLAAANRKGYQIDDYRAAEWQGIRKRLLALFPRGPENTFCHWLGCEIAEPVIAGDTVKGVLVALSSIPSWLSADDADVVKEFALKTGLCLEAKRLMRQLNWHLNAKISLNEITAVMARTSDVNSLYRLFLLAITTNECLGFSRAILFLRQTGPDYMLSVTEAVGAQSQREAELRWGEADAVPLQEKMQTCTRPPRSRPGDLREVTSQLTLDLEQYPEIFPSLREGRTLVRRRGDPHILRDRWFHEVLYPEGSRDGEYVLAPLTAGGEVTGAVLADRAFLESTDIDPARLELLQFIAGEFALMIESLKLHREEEEARIAKELARGISYSLRTRAAALETRIANFAHDLGGAHQEVIDGLKRAVQFFGRAGTVASKLQCLEEIDVGRGEKLDLNGILNGIVDFLSDARIHSVLADAPVCVQAEVRYIEDILLEIIWNACDFTDRETGKIEVTVQAEGPIARVDCKDNGPGIHPDFREHLFKPYRCYPASRMGLGLSYVARLVKAYDGTIKEIGTWQQGAHFIVRIPLAREY